jgi:hypothetical protein
MDARRTRLNRSAVVCCIAFVAAGLLVCGGAGCGRRGPAVEMVEGIVLLDGQPVEGATVLFSPETLGSDGGLPAAGRTGSDGVFRLNAAGGAKFGAGTKVGDYTVTIVKQDHDPVPPPDPEKPPSGPPNVKVWDVLPVVYKHAITTPLRATVKKGKNSYRFELDSSAVASPKSDVTSPKQ